MIRETVSLLWMGFSSEIVAFTNKPLTTQKWRRDKTFT